MNRRPASATSGRLTSLLKASTIGAVTRYRAASGAKPMYLKSLLVAVVAVLVDQKVVDYGIVFAGIVVGSALGAVLSDFWPEVLAP